VAAVVLYTDGENGGKQDGKEKDKGHGGDETSKSGDMFAMIYLRVECGFRAM
jgi:hypothetical protein